MAGAITRYLEQDHARIDDALRLAANRGGDFEPTADTSVWKKKSCCRPRESPMANPFRTLIHPERF
jgi:hypothetical protein